MRILKVPTPPFLTLKGDLKSFLVLPSSILRLVSSRCIRKIYSYILLQKKNPIPFFLFAGLREGESEKHEVNNRQTCNGKSLKKNSQRHKIHSVGQVPEPRKPISCLNRLQEEGEVRTLDFRIK